MIEQFIQMATSQLNVPQNDVEQATSGLLSMLAQNANAGDFQSLLGKIGGAEDLMNQFDAGNNLTGIAEADGAGGLLGGIAGAVGGMLGGSLGGNLGAIASLVSQLNLDSGQLGQLAQLFMGFLNENAGESLTSSVMGGLGDFIQGQAA